MARRTVKLLILGALATVVSGGCERAAIEPELEQYNIYIAALDWVDGIATDPLYVLDAQTLEVIDTISQVGSLWDMEVSPDGRWLYAYVHRGSAAPYLPINDSLRCMDLKSKRIVWAIPSGLSTSISLIDSGNLILRRWAESGDVPGGQDILSAATGDVIQTLPSQPWFFEGPVDGTKSAAVIELKQKPGIDRIEAVDVLSGKRNGGYIPHLSNGQQLVTRFARLHPDGRRVLVVAGLGVPSPAWALIGDLETGETLVMARISGIYAEGAFSPDGRFAVTADYQGGFNLLDLDAMSPVECSLPITSGQVEFIGHTNDIVTAPWGFYWRAGAMYQVGLDELQVRSETQLPLPEPLIGALAVGRRP